jgi:hypothetical protein
MAQQWRLLTCCAVTSSSWCSRTSSPRSPCPCCSRSMSRELRRSETLMMQTASMQLAPRHRAAPRIHLGRGSIFVRLLLGRCCCGVANVLPHVGLTLPLLVAMAAGAPCTWRRCGAAAGCRSGTDGADSEGPTAAGAADGADGASTETSSAIAAGDAAAAIGPGARRADWRAGGASQDATVGSSGTGGGADVDAVPGCGTELSVASLWRLPPDPAAGSAFPDGGSISTVPRSPCPPPSSRLPSAAPGGSSNTRSRLAARDSPPDAFGILGSA